MPQQKTKEGKQKSMSNLKKGGVVSRTVLYNKMSRLAPKAIEKLEVLLDHTNPAIQLGAINKVLDKTLPDQKQEGPSVAVQVNFKEHVSAELKEFETDV